MRARVCVCGAVVSSILVFTFVLVVVGVCVYFSCGILPLVGQQQQQQPVLMNYNHKLLKYLSKTCAKNDDMQKIWI